MQLDLFSDNRNVMLQNDVVAALRRRDQIAGGETLAILSAEYPRDRLLMPLAALLNTLAAVPGRFPDHNGVADALHNMDSFDVAFEADDETDLAWFPAWVLIAEPALAFILRETQVCGNSAPERVARLIIELLALERQGRHADLVAQRKRLRDLHAGLFSRYMSTR